jgi:murein tripeptide amidase MpaA
MRSRVISWISPFVFIALFTGFAVAICAGSSLAAAQVATENSGGDTRNDAAYAAGTYVVRIPLKDRNLQKRLVDHNIEILALVKGGYLDVLAEEKDLDFLMTLGVPVSVIHAPGMVSPGATALDANLGLYHTYAELQTALTNLETTYPTLADLSTMGQSGQGRNIYVLKISDNVTVDENEPEVLYMGNHHARELMTVDIPLMFAEYLLAHYGTDPDVTAMVDSREIFIAPMVNPDGQYYVQQNHSDPNSDNWWRKNRRRNYDASYGVDLNRNYGYLWGYDNSGSSPTPSSPIYRGASAFSEYETQAIRNFCAGRHITLGLSFHSYGELFLFPWDYALLYTPDHDVFVAMADSLTSGNGYEAGTSPSLLYTVNGGSDDWAYGDTVTKERFFCFTAEMNNSGQGGFAPAESYIQPTFDLLLPMNMDVLHFADNPYRVIPPAQPTQYAIDQSDYPYYTLSWSSSVPSDLNPATGYDVVEYKNLGSLAQDPANVLSDLWAYDGFTVSTARKYEGTGSYYSGMVNLSSHTLRMATFYRVTVDTDSLRTRVWYNIENGWDYAYLEVSTDGGRIWQTVPGNITTNSNPNGTNRGNGITGASSGWVLGIFPLTQFLGTDLEVRFNYVTDQGTVEEGIYIDLPGPVPTYEEKTLVASALPDTSLAITPDEVAEFTYRVRARDAESQVSLWSLTRSITIDDLTAVGDTPVLASRLGANYPNPFNPVTRIPYTVGALQGSQQPVRVTLKIYSVAGSRVATLVDRDLSPGVHEAVWKATTDNGAPLASGVYFARLTVGGEQGLTRKLVLLK